MNLKRIALLLAIISVFLLFPSCSSSPNVLENIQKIGNIVYERYSDNENYYHYTDTLNGPMYEYIEYPISNDSNSKLELEYYLRVSYGNDRKVTSIEFSSKESSDLAQSLFPKYGEDKDYVSSYSSLYCTLGGTVNGSMIWAFDSIDSIDSLSYDIGFDFVAWPGAKSIRYHYECSNDTIKSATCIGDLGKLSWISLGNNGDRRQAPDLLEYYKSSAQGEIIRGILPSFLSDYNTCLQSEFGLTLKDIGFEKYEF